jgi:hypothetical protein
MVNWISQKLFCLQSKIVSFASNSQFVLCPPVTGWPSYTTRHRLLIASYVTQGYGGGIVTRLQTGNTY